MPVARLRNNGAARARLRQPVGARQIDVKHRSAAGRVVEANLEQVSIAGIRATALALVFSELLQNALEHGSGSVRIELAQRNGNVVLAIRDEGAGPGDAAEGTGLSIVGALVRDELQGSFALIDDGGTRAEVVFPI